jgi:hypothetical protein
MPGSKDQRQKVTAAETQMLEIRSLLMLLSQRAAQYQERSLSAFYAKLDRLLDGLKDKSKLADFIAERGPSAKGQIIHSENLSAPVLEILTKHNITLVGMPPRPDKVAVSSSAAVLGALAVVQEQRADDDAIAEEEPLNAGWSAVVLEPQPQQAAAFSWLSPSTWWSSGAGPKSDVAAAVPVEMPGSMPGVLN